jgi:hypothetical protein
MSQLPPLIGGTAAVHIPGSCLNWGPKWTSIFVLRNQHLILELSSLGICEEIMPSVIPFYTLLKNFRIGLENEISCLFVSETQAG